MSERDERLRRLSARRGGERFVSRPRSYVTRMSDEVLGRADDEWDRSSRGISSPSGGFSDDIIIIIILQPHDAFELAWL